jgi:hypothetical protein
MGESREVCGHQAAIAEVEALHRPRRSVSGIMATTACLPWVKSYRASRLEARLFYPESCRGCCRLARLLWANSGLTVYKSNNSTSGFGAIEVATN